jgi:hypothetical protein
VARGRRERRYRVQRRQSALDRQEADAAGTIHRDCGGNSVHKFYGSEAAVAEWINNGAAPVNINQEKAQQ